MKKYGKTYLAIVVELALAGPLGCGDDAGDTRATGAEPGASDTDISDDDRDDDDDAQPDGETGGMDGASESSGGGADVCEQAQFSFEVESGTPNVMLVLDKSRSMTNVWDHDLDPATPEISRWHSLRNVVDHLATEFGDAINFGAQLFPAADAWLDEPANAWSCRVHDGPEVPVGSGSAAEILAAIPAGDDFSISGGTPTVAGLQSAVRHLDGLADDGPRAIVLVTDGAANCSTTELHEDTLFVYDHRVPVMVADAYDQHQIPVYVVGINILDELGEKPSVNAYDAVTHAALVGGAAAPGGEAFYNTFNELELESALDTVIDKIECTVALEVEPEAPEAVEVTVDGIGFENVDDCDAGDGWAYTAPGGPYGAIVLCGTACDALQDGATVEVDYSCPAEG